MKKAIMNQKAENHFLAATPDSVPSKPCGIRAGASPAPVWSGGWAVPPAPPRAQGPAPSHAAAVKETFFLKNIFYNKEGGRGEIRSEFLLGASHSACNVM